MDFRGFEAMRSHLEAEMRSAGLVDGTSTAPGRVKQYLESPEKGLLPYSCKLRVYRNDVIQTMQDVSKDLRWGAGVKLILDKFEAPEIVYPVWAFTLGTNPDREKMTENQQQFYEDKDKDYDRIIVVEDSMDGTDGISIEKSWELFYDALSQGQSVLLDLEKLRPSGSVNAVGLTATGAVGDGTDRDNTASFLGIYEAIANFAADGTIGAFLRLFGVLNGTLRRGGLYKNGIVTSSMDYRSPYFEYYLNFPLISIPGSHKKGARLDYDILERRNEAIRKLIVQKVATESLFLEKMDDRHPDLYWNVCEGLLIPDNGTCLIWRVNLGMCSTVADIIYAYRRTAGYLTTLHLTWRKNNPEKAAHSAPQHEDLQIGLDVMGLANLLAIWGVTYDRFNQAMLDYLQSYVLDFESTEGSIVSAIVLGMRAAVDESNQVCDVFDCQTLDRIFTVEPAQSHSFQTKDALGYTTCRGIFPPTTRKEKRASDTTKTKIYNHGSVETIAEVGADLLEEVCENFQMLMNETGAAHGISYDLRKDPTEGWFEDFMHSALSTKYYTEFDSTDQSYLQKVANTAQTEPVCSIAPGERCTVCEE
jgi:hypothetical protein